MNIPFLSRFFILTVPYLLGQCFVLILAVLGYQPFAFTVSFNILESSGEPQAAWINDSGISGVDCGGLYGGNDWNSGWREPGHWDMQNYGRQVVATPFVEGGYAID